MLNFYIITEILIAEPIYSDYMFTCWNIKLTIYTFVT